MCPDCNGHGFYTKGPAIRRIRPDAPDTAVFGQGLIPCACLLTRDQRRRHQQFARLPEHLRAMTFEAVKTRADYSRVQNVAFQDVFSAAYHFAAGAASNRWLLLAGSLGWGKTHLGLAVINARIDNPSWGDPGKWNFVPVLLDDLKAGFKDDSYAYILEQYRTVPLLVLDDLGTEYHKGGDALDWAAEQLFKVLDHRYIHRLETVVTTNTPIGKLNVRVRDRLLDTGTGLSRVFGLELPSYRTGRIETAEVRRG